MNTAHRHLRRTLHALALALCLVLGSVTTARAAIVTYTLDNVILDSGGAQMSGTFTWTYDEGDFENGTGQFTFLDIPYTVHDHTDLDATFDIGSSIEIVLVGSVHDDGVDITLFLLEPLTPTSGSAIDLVRSKYEIGGNGFHDGLFISGSVVPEVTVGLGDGPSPGPALATGPTAKALTASPNPFHPKTTLSYEVMHPGRVRISIHDVSGRLLTTLVDEEQALGPHSIDWNAAHLDSGLYFVRYIVGGEPGTYKAVLLSGR